MAPHWHTRVPEGGFDNRNCIHFISISASDSFQEFWRWKMIGLFLKRGPLDASLVESMLGWRHSCFSVDVGTRVYAAAAA